MDPTVAIPFHFTIETLGIASSGLVLAWALSRRKWVAAAGAAAITVAQVLHAGQFVAADDAVALVVLRLAGVGGIAAGALPDTDRRGLLSAAIAAIAGGSIWGAVSGGTAVDARIGPHVLLAIGTLILLAWVWNATRAYLRLRVLTAFVGVLSVVVVVAGGSVSRVVALDKRSQNFDLVATEARRLRMSLGALRDVETGHAAALSPSVAAELANPRTKVSIPASSLQVGEWVVAFDASGHVRASFARNASLPSSGTASAVGTPSGGDASALGSLDVVGSSLRGSVAGGFAVFRRGLGILAGAPVYRPGGTPTKGDVVGAVVVGRVVTPQELASASDARSIDVGITDGTTTAATDPTVVAARLPSPPSGQVSFPTIDTRAGKMPAAVMALENSRVELVLATRDAGVAGSANHLVRAFLIAILAASLFAVVLALWMSARVTRPMLDLAEGAERVKTDFLASISHELRTPLTPIRGYAEILRKGRVPARAASGYIDEIGQAAQRLERIVTLLVDVAAMEAGRFRIDTEPTNAVDLLSDAAGRWRGRSRRHPVSIDAPRSLPDVAADPTIVQRVFDELIDNAVKFSPDGGPIELRGRPAQDGVEFSVADKGVGVDSDRISDLTAAFEQASTGETRRFGGLGLGLAYVAGALAAHASRLRVAGEPGRGTTCSFTLAASMVSPMPADAPPRAVTKRRA